MRFIGVNKSKKWLWARTRRKNINFSRNDVEIGLKKHEIKDITTLIDNKMPQVIPARPWIKNFKWSSLDRVC